MKGTMDMTRGRIAPQLVRFSLPLMATSMLQLAYSLCDSLVVGRLIGIEAFAAVGASSFLSGLPLSMILGLTQGFGVLLAQRFGAGDEKGLRRAVGWSALLALAAAALMGTAGMLALHPLLKLMRTPEEMVAYSADYLRVIFLGLWTTALYNVAATLLRSAGDSVTPLAALVVSTLTNIALDYALVAGFGMGADGVALATVLAQLLSLLLCAARIRLRPLVLPERTAQQLSRRSDAVVLLKLGLPPMFRDGVIAVGGLYVQSFVNGFGTAFVAGLTAARRYFSLMEMGIYALEGAIATFVGQNIGANQPDRAHEGTRISAKLGLAASLLTAAFAAIFARPLIAFLVADTNAEVLHTGVFALRMMALFLPALYMLCIYRASLQSTGDSITPMLSGFTELTARLLTVILLPALIGSGAACIADGLGWVAAAALLMSVYSLKQRKKIP